MSENHSFQVNLKGVIELLSGHLYSGPNVFVRELLQNSVDAITARQLLDPEVTGEISIEIIQGADGSNPTMIVTDNGIGLTEAETHRFLATIGQSSKREHIDRTSFIGQFGIGMLSAFMVCDEIVLISRSAHPDATTVKWSGRSDGTYSIEKLDQDFQPGSQVYLQAKPGCHDFFDPEFVQQIASQYGEFLNVPITLSSNGTQHSINRMPPWELISDDNHNQRILEFAENQTGTQYLDAIPLHSTVGGVNGIAYVLPDSMNKPGRRGDSVYLKGMLVSKNVDNLLPEWAFFVRCVLNVTDLNPTASRESFHEDELLLETRADLGRALKSWLKKLAQSNPERLNQIVDIHHLPIKALAVDDDEFYRLFIDWLPFETTMGSMSMGEIRRQNPTIRYVDNRDEFRQIASVASAQDICLVNAGYVYDTELIERLGLFLPNGSSEKVDVNQLAQEFTELTLDERDQVMGFLRTADSALQPFRCQADVRKFQPENLPTLYTACDQATFYRNIEQTKDVANDLFSGVLDSIKQETPVSNWAQLCFNFSNPLVQRLCQLSDRQLIRRSVEMIYVQSLLMGHHPLSRAETVLLNSGLLGLIEQVINEK